jgi:predicted porin
MRISLTAVATVCALVVTASAHAQSSVQLWGALDAGITMITNQKGAHNYLMDNGIAMPNLWGLRGSEDLGSGYKAIFELVNQFNLGTGAIFPTNGGGLFSRNAYVGLSNDRYGKLTFGQQYDFMIDSLLRFDNSIYIAGLYGFRQGPFAGLGIPGNLSGSTNFDRMSGTAISNSVKYTTPSFYGFTGGTLYSFGGVPGAIAQNDGKSFGLNYVNGSFSAGAAYTYQRYAQLANGMAGIRNFGAGAEYKFGLAALSVLYTNTKNTANNATINVYQIGTRYQITPALSIGGDYELMKGNAVLHSDKANQFSLGVRYALSKRTVLYTEAVYQKVSGDNNPQAWIMAVSNASSNDKQLLTRVGILHRF